MAHGENNSSLFTGMPEEAERAIIKTCSTLLRSSTGKKPRGWLGPALTETDNTLDLLAEAGIDYVADWCNDEQPYAMRTRKGSIVAMPYTLEIGDIPVFLQHGGSGEDFERMIVDQFDTMYEEGAQTAARPFDRIASLPDRTSVPRALPGARAGAYPQARRSLDHDRQRDHRLVQVKVVVIDEASTLLFWLSRTSDCARRAAGANREELRCGTT